MSLLPSVNNLLRSVDGTDEQFVELLRTGSARLEHILSCGQASESGFWYDQSEDEWVMLLAGEAILEFENGSLSLVAGDSLLIPAGQRHRVASVSQDAIWLALHYTA